MNLFFSPEQLQHRPTQYGVHGRLVRPLENPDRADTLVQSLTATGLSIRQPVDNGREPILTVHADHYLQYLEEAYELFQELPNPGPEALPNVHPYVSSGPDFAPRPRPRTTGILGRTGWYVGDLSCAITQGTFPAAYASAQSAISAADDVVRHGARASIALCRPPGHHAYADRANGFCFLNNAAIATERLRTRFGQVAIIDFDTHHGDGTQAIFYRRRDVFVGSVHTDPTAYYPHFAGYADERGAGEGENCNLNIPLALGSGDDDLVGGVERLLEAAVRSGAGALVVSAGWDAHRDDPLSRLDVGTQAYARIAELLATARLPTVIVQEGGYSLSAVSEAAPLFVQTFVAATA